jgi:hypothetical protein
MAIFMRVSEAEGNGVVSHIDRTQLIPERLGGWSKNPKRIGCCGFVLRIAVRAWGNEALYDGSALRNARIC